MIHRFLLGILLTGLMTAAADTVAESHAAEYFIKVEPEPDNLYRLSFIILESKGRAVSLTPENRKLFQELKKYRGSAADPAVFPDASFAVERIELLVPAGHFCYAHCPKSPGSPQNLSGFEKVLTGKLSPLPESRELVNLELDWKKRLVNPVTQVTSEEQCNTSLTLSSGIFRFVGGFSKVNTQPSLSTP